YVTDVIEKSDKNKDYIDKLNKLDCPIVLIINKIYLSNQEEVERLIKMWKDFIPKAEIFPASALERFNLETIFEKIIDLLPASPPWYDKEIFTDKSLRFFASEILREKILINYSKEIPYCTEVIIEEFKELNNRFDISAVINVMRDSQKGIIIGNKGLALKKVGTQARIDMEAFFEKKVFLQIFVKVEPNWREDKRKLKKFGYIQD
ncbi:MAG: GTPase Era, partial [Bacteroidales bacterium]